jgi:hypothetical protein
MEILSENKNPKHWTAIYVGIMSYLSSDEKQNLGLHFVVLESTSSILGGGQRF